MSGILSKFKGKLVDKVLEQLSNMNAKQMFQMFQKSILPFLEASAYKVEFKSQMVSDEKGNVWFAILFRDKKNES